MGVAIQTAYCAGVVGPDGQESKNTRITPMLNQIITRFSLTAGHLRLGLALISLVALVFGGSASAHWD
jgi:hypothetical protein